MVKRKQSQSQKGNEEGSSFPKSPVQNGEQDQNYQGQKDHDGQNDGWIGDPQDPNRSRADSGYKKR